MDTSSNSINNDLPATGTSFNNRPSLRHYIPGDDDVLCGRGSSCFNHIGNKRFRWLIEENLDRYSIAETKSKKTLIICYIVNIVRSKSSNGGFVKKCDKEGRYFEVGDFHAVRFKKIGYTRIKFISV